MSRGDHRGLMVRETHSSWIKKPVKNALIQGQLKKKPQAFDFMSM